jgi:hypothetical protein
VRIADVVPRERCFASDFKCSTPGEDEARVFDELARLAQIDAGVLEQPASEMFRAGFVTLAIRVAGKLELIAMRHTPYCVPPTKMIELINGELERLDREHRMVACRDDATTAVVLVTPAELMELESGGLVVS